MASATAGSSSGKTSGIFDGSPAVTVVLGRDDEISSPPADVSLVGGSGIDEADKTLEAMGYRPVSWTSFST